MYFVKTKTIDFENNKNFCIYKIDGLCPPSASLNFSTIANVDGKVYNSGRINERNIVLYIKIYPNVAVNRNLLYQHFPIGGKIRIFFKNDLNNVYIDGYVESFECDFFTSNEIAQISIICNDPYFRSVNKESISVSVVQSYFEFPFSIPVNEPVVISDRDFYISKTLNPGLLPTGIIAEFEAIDDGVITPWITNETTSQTIKLVGEDGRLNTGEKIIVNTNRHNLSIIKIFSDGSTKNILNAMDKNFQWIKLIPGDNVLKCGADLNVQNLITTISIEKLLLGV